MAEKLIRKEITAGDAAVDGLLAGGGAGIVMVIYLLLVGLGAGEAVGMTLGRFDPNQAGSGSGSPLIGALMHLAIAGIYGALFALGVWFIPRRWRYRLPGWLIGLAYGLILLVVAQIIFLSGSDSPLRQIPSWRFAVAHVIYGLTLGLLINRSDTLR